jgi:hypothetical protein
MPRLKNLRIEEVSSVDRGAGKGVRVMLLKRHNERNSHMQTEEILKAAQSGNVSEPTMFAAMTVLARQYFPLAKSEAEAWVQFTEHNAIGKRMDAVRRTLPKGTFEERVGFVKTMAEYAKAGTIPRAVRAQPDDDREDDDDDADKAIDALAEQHRAKNPTMTKEQCVAHVIEHHPDGKRLYAESKRKHLAKNAA